jgi:Tfp pilus assembly protein FimT
VVLAIVVLSLGIVLPYLANAAGGLGQRAATAELRVALQGASSEAVTRGRTVVFRADPRGGFWVDRRYSQLGSGERLVVAGSGRIAFYPWGGSSGGRVWVEGPGGRRPIDVDAVTGRAILAP